MAWISDACPHTKCSCNTRFIWHTGKDVHAVFVETVAQDYISNSTHSPESDEDDKMKKHSNREFLVSMTLAHFLCYSINKVILLMQKRISTLHVITDTSPVPWKSVKICLTGLRGKHSCPVLSSVSEPIGSLTLESVQKMWRLLLTVHSEVTKCVCAQVSEHITGAARQEVPVDMNEPAFQ